MSQGTWYAIEVNNSSARQLALGYSLELVFDHQALVNNGGNANGNDIAIVSNRNGTVTTLHRVLDPDSAWNRSTTKIWIGLDQTVAAQSVSNRQFYLVVGHPTHATRSNAKQVFPIWDDFNSGGLDNTVWNPSNSSSGINGMQSSGGQVRLYAEPTSVTVHSTVQSDALDLPAGIAFETRAKSGPISGSYANCAHSHLFAARTASGNRVLGALRLTNGSYLFESYDDQNGTTSVQPVSAGTDGDNAWHTYRLEWEQGTMEIWRDQARIHQGSPAGSQLRPDQNRVRLGFAAITGVGGCSGPVQQVQVEVEWARMRYLNRPAPTAVLVTP